MTHGGPCSPLPGMGVGVVVVGKLFVCGCGRDIGMSVQVKVSVLMCTSRVHKNVGMYPDSSPCTFTLGEGESWGREGW